MLDPVEFDVNTLFKTENARDRAVEQLLDLCESDVGVRAVLDAFGADREDLFALYWELLANGAGQWARGHFVAASALAYGQTLAYCLKATAEGTGIRGVAFRCLEYFNRGETGLIDDDR